MRKKAAKGRSFVLLRKCRFLSVVLVSLLIDLAFLLIWALALVAYDKLIHWIDPTESRALIGIVKVICELSTLSVVVVFILADIRKIIIRIWDESGKRVATGIAQKNVTIDKKSQRKHQNREASS
jgi:hypothetical protein